MEVEYENSVTVGGQSEEMQVSSGAPEVSPAPAFDSPSETEKEKDEAGFSPAAPEVPAEEATGARAMEEGAASSSCVTGASESAPSSSSEPTVVDESAPSSSSEPTVVTEAAPAVIEQVAINYELSPSLRGKLEKVDDPISGATKIMCRGLWAMRDADHAEGKTSKFEFSLVEREAGTSPTDFPPSGLYRGHFLLKRVAPSTGYDKVDEKSIHLNFAAEDREQGGTGWKMSGKGVNRYGNYILDGRLEADGTLLLYRQYVVFKTDPNAPPPVKKSSKDKKTKKSSSGAVGDMGSPREATVRDRKKSLSLSNGALDPARPVKSGGTKIKTEGGEAESSGFGVSSSAGSSSSIYSAPTARLAAQPLVKCGELLRDLMKLPSAVYFLEPVDPVKLGIPDYPKVITEPMDMGTLRSLLDSGEIDSLESFVANMRLIFRNAITFNPVKESVVHMAAVELACTFEVRLNSLHYPQKQQQQQQQQLQPPPPKAAPKASVGGGVGGSAQNRKSSPRPLQHKQHQSVMMPPDGSMQAMLEMQRKMQEMQNEIIALRTAQTKTEIKSNLSQMQQDAQNPLTYQEKTALVDGIGKLSPQDQIGLFSIMRESSSAPLAGATDDDEMELDVDQIDTHTLRKLQRYVESRKRGFRAVATKNEPPAKRPRPETSGFVPTAVPSASSNGAWGGGLGGGMDVDYDLGFNPQELKDDVVVAAPAGTGVNVAPASSSSSSSSATSAFGTNAGTAAGGDASRKRSDSLGADEYELLLEQKQAEPAEVRLANASAWANANPATGAVADASSSQRPNTNSSSWGEAASEMQAKMDREQQRKAEEARLQEQRKREEAERLGALKDAADKQARDREEAEAAAERQRAEKERQLQERREEERRQRESMAQAVKVEQNTDVLSMLHGGV